MKNRLAGIITGVLLTVTCHAQGGMNGGGGRAVVCRDSSGKITSAELLDLYEAREVFGYVLRVSAPTEEAELQTTAAEYRRYFGYDLKEQVGPNLSAGPLSVEDVAESLRKEFETTRQKFRFIQLPNRLQQVPDSHEPVATDGCQAEQLAIYYLDQLILVQKEIYEHLDPMNKLALLIHEQEYKDKRKVGATDSRRVRRTVGELFSVGLRSSRSEFLSFKGDATRNEMTWQCGQFLRAVGIPGRQVRYALYAYLPPGSGNSIVTLEKLAFTEPQEDGFLQYLAGSNPSWISTAKPAIDAFGNRFFLKLGSKLSGPSFDETMFGKAIEYSIEGAGGGAIGCYQIRD